MSYILDALRKAERERHLTRVPTLETVHLPESSSRRRLWPWVLAGALLMNAGVLVVLLRPTLTAVPLKAADSGGKPAAAPPVMVLERAVPEQAAGRATDLGSADRTASAGAVPPQMTPPASRAPAARPTPADTTLLADQRGDATPTPALAPAPAERSPADPKPELREPAGDRTTGAASADTARRQESKLTASEPADPKATEQTEPSGPVTPSGDVKPPRQGAPAPPSLQDLPATVQEAIPRMTLDVLVYSEREAERMVFINSRKYIEGQRVDGKFVVEGITREGAILSYEGQRFLLRPKSNPYVRPVP